MLELLAWMLDFAVLYSLKCQNLSRTAGRLVRSKERSWTSKTQFLPRQTSP